MSKWIPTGSCLGLGLMLLLAVAADASWARWWRAPLPVDLHLVLLGAAFVPYAAIVQGIVRGAGTGHRADSVWRLRGLLGLAVLLRLVTLLGPHRYNSDLYRYLWDGHVLASGHNPYAYAPADTALDAIRDARLYDNMNPAYNEIRTVYGPVATACFAVCSRVPWDRVWTIRLLMTAGDLLALVLVIQLLRCCNLPRIWALIYGLNPLVLDSFAQRGQVEGLLLPLLVLAVLFVAGRRHYDAGAVLGAAALVKVAAVIVLPLFIRAAWDRDRESAARLVCGFLMILLVIGLPVWVALPQSLDGLLIYSARWQSNEGLFGLARAMGGPTFARAVGLLGISAVVAACLGSMKGEGQGTRAEGRVLAARVGAVLAGVLLFAPAVFCWYVTWSVPFVPFLLGSRRWRWAGLAVLCWSATVLFWYLRFLVYPPVDVPHWPGLAHALQTAAHWMREPWRMVEYLAVAAVALMLRPWRAEKHGGRKLHGTEYRHVPSGRLQ